jgi:uncharacterized protein (DUF2461 family)
MNEMRFAGFSPNFFSFFSEFAENNNKNWLDLHRDEYRTHVLATIKAFGADLGLVVKKLNPELETEPRVGRTISRIDVDRHFRRIRVPGRTLMYLTYSRRGDRRSHSPLLYAGIGADGVSIGFYPGGERPPRPGPVQVSISQNLRAFERYLVDRHISQKYWELSQGRDGRLKRWPLPKSARRWVDLESFTVGEHFSATEQVVRRRSFLDRAQTILLDLYPLWLFATSDDLKRDLELYGETVNALSRTLTRSKRSSDDRRQLGSDHRKETPGSVRGIR